MPDTDNLAPVTEQELDELAPASWRDILPIHPAADLFPLMSPDELKVLGEDIKKNGLKIPVTVWRGKRGALQLLDGRNRLDAMQAVGIPIKRLNRSIEYYCEEPMTWEDASQCVDADTDPYEYVISANIHRRHFTAEQKRELIATVIKATPDKSDRQIAKTVKVSPTTVGTVRTEMEATGDVSKLDTRKDKRGRQQPARKASTKPPQVSEEVLHQRAAAAERIRDLMGGDKTDPGSESASGNTMAQERHFEFQNIALRSEVEELKAQVRGLEDRGPAPKITKAVKTGSQQLNSLAWSDASPDERARFLNAIGKSAVLAAAPPGWNLDEESVLRAAAVEKLIGEIRRRAPAQLAKRLTPDRGGPILDLEPVSVAAAAASRALGVSRTYIETAAKLSPDQLRQVRQGWCSLADLKPVTALEPNNARVTTPDDVATWWWAASEADRAAVVGTIGVASTWDALAKNLV